MDYPLMLCSVCGKKQATKLCDAPIKRMHWVGHPPRSSAVFLPTKIVWETPMHYTITCDRPLCDKCAVSIFPEIDYCPDCIRRIKQMT